MLDQVLEQVDDLGLQGDAATLLAQLGEGKMEGEGSEGDGGRRGSLHGARMVLHGVTPARAERPDVLRAARRPAPANSDPRARGTRTLRGTSRSTQCGRARPACRPGCGARAACPVRSSEC